MKKDELVLLTAIIQGLCARNTIKTYLIPSVAMQILKATQEEIAREYKEGAKNGN